MHIYYATLLFHHPYPRSAGELMLSVLILYIIGYYLGRSDQIKEKERKKNEELRELERRIEEREKKKL